MSRNVVISGLGPVSGLGIGIEPTWESLRSGHSAVDAITAFDPSGFECRIAAEVHDFKINRYVPKSYRKATKVMARDIGIAVAAADSAARDASLVTKGTASNGEPNAYEGPRMGCHIGAGLIAAELDELTSALATSRGDDGTFDIHHWGREGIANLYPLWLLKYLPNMLACHVTIIHDTQGPSNTITCGDTSSTLSIGESLRVIQRGAADMCFCGGAESKVNPMALLRQCLAGRVTTEGNDDPARAVRPLCHSASGTAVGEGGAILVLEAAETFAARNGDGNRRAYARVAGFGASQTFSPSTGNLMPDPEGEGIAQAIASALDEAEMDADRVNLIIPFAMAHPDCDRAEASALRSIFGARLPGIPLAPLTALSGHCGAGSGALAACSAAAALRHQTIPAVINCSQPLDGLNAATAACRHSDLDVVLVITTGMGGQNAALVLEKIED